MKKVILEVDTGIDDALAIAYAVLSPEIELLGIIATYGMAPVEYTYRNTNKILELLEKDIPVFKGAEQPFVLKKEYKGTIHGNDGLGNTLGPITDDQKLSQTKKGIDFIIEQVRTHKENLTIITTGPLTTLAHAINKDPDIVHMVGGVVSMGGAVMSPGNVTKFAEANIIIDPHAAKTVFTSELPMTMVGLDVTRKTLLTKEDVDRWRAKGTKVSLFFAEFTEFYLNAYKKIHPYLKGCALHDPLAVAVAKQPDFVRTVPMHITVDLEEGAIGRTTEDLHREKTDLLNTNVCVQVDAERFMEDFFKRVI